MNINRDRRPGSATVHQALLTDAQRVNTLKHSRDMPGTLRKKPNVVSDYNPTYEEAPKQDLSSGPKSSSLGFGNPSYDDPKSRLGFGNPSYDDTGDFQYE